MIKERQKKAVRIKIPTTRLKNNLTSLHIKNNSITNHKIKTSLVPFNIRQQRTQSYIQKHLKQSLPPGCYQVNKSSFEKASYHSSLQKLQINPRLDVLNRQLDVKFQHQVFNFQTSPFKSHALRFKASSNEKYPGPAHYKVLNMRKYHKREFTQFDKNSSNSMHLETLNKSTLPSIPDCNNKYGYYQTSNGQFRTVRKTENQLHKQKEKQKLYNFQKINENLQSYYKLGGTFHIDEQQRQVHTIYAKAKSLEKNSNEEKEKNIISGKLINPWKNRKESKKLTQPSYKLKSLHLNQVGPGSYNYNLNTIKVGKKIQRHQYFGSTQKRFCEKRTSLLNKTELNNKQNVFNNPKLEFINKNNVIQVKKIIRKNLPYKIRQKLYENFEQYSSPANSTPIKSNSKQQYQFKITDQIHKNPLKQTKDYYLELKLPSFKKISAKNILKQSVEKNILDQINLSVNKQNTAYNQQICIQSTKKRKSKQIIVSFNIPAQKINLLPSQYNNNYNQVLQYNPFVSANIDN